MTIEIQEVSILGEAAQLLIAELDRELSAEYAPQDRHTVDFEPFHREGGRFVVAFLEGEPIACGGLRPYSRTETEVKRMFVRPEFRRRGFSKQILAELETIAARDAFSRLLLETGDGQPAAIGLYESTGFERIPPFGEYTGARSVCFAKNIG